MKILETDFGHGENFLRHWGGWVAHTELLHYVALVTRPIDLSALKRHPAEHPGAVKLAHELAAQCDGLVPGFHRLMFEGGNVLLTLCVGNLKTQLKALQFEADLVLLTDLAPLGFPGPLWDIWAVKSLAKSCRRGTTVTCVAPSPELLTRLHQCGFEMTPPSITTAGIAEFVGRYNPRWEPKNSRGSAPHHAAPMKLGHCVVIGAGLAGASAAASLARRGWRVTVLDAAAGPALGASGLPVGLMVPHVTADDSPRSRLSRCGMRMTLQQTTTLLAAGHDWEASGVLERRLDGELGLPNDGLQRDFDGGTAWSRPASNDNTNDTPAWRDGLPRPDPALWHGKAAWIKPAGLVRAWLAQPGVTFQGNSAVSSLVKSGHQWSACDAQGQCLAAGDLVVIANAGGASDLLAQLKATLPQERLIASALAQLQTVEGQVSWAMHWQGDGNNEGDVGDARQFPPFPVNGLGSLVAHVPMNDGQTAWFAGATFEREGDELSISAGHQANLARLKTLLPASGAAFADKLKNNNVHAWRNTRCTSTDRMPLCGPLTLYEEHTSSMWLISALGARGLSLAVLCAELLAARVHHEPWPIEATLARTIDTDRKKCLKSSSCIDS